MSNVVNVGQEWGSFFSSVTARRVTAAIYTILSDDMVIFFDTDGAAIAADLPAGVHGKCYRVVNCGSSGNNLTLTPDGAELLEGANAAITLIDGEVYEIVYETTEGWW